MISSPEHYNPRHWYPVPIIVFLFFLGVGISGCSVFSPVGQFISHRYENVVAYFNTYYNASTAFEEAETEVLLQQENLRVKDQPVKPGDISAAAKQKFDLSIEKFSRLLTFYPTSKWVDRSLFMIGKAYFYKGDFVRAERKFRELITTIPESDYVPAASLWYGRSLFGSNAFDDARKEFTTLIPNAYERGEKTVGAEAGLLLGQTCLKLEDTSGAISAFQSVIERSNDPSRSAEAQLWIAEILSVKGNPDDVLKEFEKVRQYEPEFITEYKSHIRYAQYLTKIGHYDDAITELNYLIERPQYSEYIAPIKYSLAYAHHQKGDIEEAVSRYIEIDTLYRGTDAAAQSYFQRGMIQQKDSGNYREAAAMFDKARVEYAQAPISQKAGDFADNAKQYILLRGIIYRSDSLLGRIKYPRDTVSEATGHQDSLTQPHMIRDSSVGAGPVSDTVAAPVIDISELDSIQIEGPEKIKPGHNIRPDTLIAKKDTTLKPKTGIVDSTAKVKSSGVDTTKILRERVEALYDLGSLLYLRMNEPDSAVGVFQEVLHGSPPDDVAAGTLFTLGQIYRTILKDRPALADSLNDSILVRYPKTKYAQEIRRQRGVQVDEFTEETNANTLFLDAEKSVSDSSNDEALRKFGMVIEKYPKSEQAVKAHYAIGWHYENTYKKLDSAAAWYTTLMTKFPSSLYATRVKAKLDEVAGVKRVKDSIATAAAKRFTKDSLAAIQKTAKSDSTRKTGIDSLSRKIPHTGPGDSTDTAVTDTLQKRSKKQRMPGDDRESLKRSGMKRGQNELPVRSNNEGTARDTSITPDQKMQQSGDSLGRNRGAPELIDSLHPTVRDSLPNNPEKSKPMDETEKLQGHPGEKQNPRDTSEVFQSHTGQNDTSATSLPDSLVKKRTRSIRGEAGKQEPEQRPALPDTTKH
jgi:TolA-binding protein